MKRRITIFASGLSVFAMVMALALFAGSVPAWAATFVVTKTADTADGTCDADCSLREAIIAANAAAGDDTITVPAGTHTLTIAGTGENAAATGDLDITSNITINGAGAGSTIIQAGTLGVGGPPNGIDRVFEVTGAFTVNISGVTVRNGNSGNGGGIFNNGTLAVTNSTFSGNSADNAGGIFNNAGTLTITNSTFSGNSAGAGVGGGIFSNSMLTITNSTISSNSASGSGGGIFNDSAGGGTATITNSTISSNSASGSGGGIFRLAGTVTLRNTIVANNTAPAGNNCSGTITNGGNNIDDGTTCGWTTVNGSMSSTNPLLGALASNGGPTQTMALLAGSPAIDGVTFSAPNSAPSTDQRGISRPQGVRYDIGAYEYQQQAVSVPTMTEWGMIIFMLLAGLGSIYYLRRLRRG